jgi:superfamily II DNA or RNA helicase
MLHTAAGKGMRSLFIVHRRELIKQSTSAFALEGLKHGIISAGFFEDRRHLVQIGSIQTLVKRAGRLGPPRLIVWDECHHLAAGSWSSLFKSFPDSFHIGLTATPERLDGQGLQAFFKEMIHGPSVQALIEQGYLSPYKLYAPMKVNIGGVHTRMGDYVRSELEAIMNKPAIIGDVITHYRKYADGKKTLVFCPTIKHSQRVAEEFCSAGYKAMHVDGETDSGVRDEAMRRFKEDGLQIITSVEIFGEGVDVPGIECVVLLRATASTGLFLQQVGRALRPAPGKKEAILLDHVGNWSRHGLPDDDRQWSLEGHAGRPRKEGGPGETVRICPSCFAAQPSGAPTCKYCGTQFPIKPREVRQVEGELEEIQRETTRKIVRREQGMAQSMQELYEIGKSRGYKNPRAWAYFVFKGRQMKKVHG